MNQTITTVKPKFSPPKLIGSVIEGLMPIRTGYYVRFMVGASSYFTTSYIKTNLKIEKIEDVDWIKEGF